MINETCHCGAARTVDFDDETAETEMLAIRAWRHSHYCDRPGWTPVTPERDALAELFEIQREAEARP